jgi:hypothetical protein
VRDDLAARAQARAAEFSIDRTATAYRALYRRLAADATSSMSRATAPGREVHA